MLPRLYFIVFIIICFTNCGGYKNKSTQQEKKVKAIAIKDNSNLLDTGIDFTALGNEPSAWEIKINFEDSIYFTAVDENKFTVAANKSSIIKTDKEIKINSILKSDSIEILIQKEYCIDKQKLQKVTVKYRNKTYTGCGLYLQNPAIQAKWILYKFRNKFVEEYAVIPTMTIYLDKNRMSWTDGCNKIGAEIKIEGDKIFFTENVFYKSTCPINELTTIIRNNMFGKGKVTTYYFKDGMLYLYLMDDSLLVFKKSN